MPLQGKFPMGILKPERKEQAAISLFDNHHIENVARFSI
jgi:hypothetical protein